MHKDKLTYQTEVNQELLLIKNITIE